MFQRTALLLRDLLCGLFPSAQHCARIYALCEQEAIGSRTIPSTA